MYAVIATGGKQYRVEQGSVLRIEKLAAEPGAEVTFDQVLLVGAGESVKVGAPLVGGASVRATVEKQKMVSRGSSDFMTTKGRRRDGFPSGEWRNIIGRIPRRWEDKSKQSSHSVTGVRLPTPVTE